jgi:DNA polymerase
MSRRDSMLREMGIAPLWRDRASPSPQQTAVEAMANVQAPVEAPPPAAPARVDAAPARPVTPVVAPVAAPSATVSAEGLGWDELEQRIRACQACRLSERRTQAVPGEPFVGQAGKLLDAMLASLGLARGHNVYIANAVKCRPPGNRTPEADEIATCHPYLDRQIELIRPRIIVALGRPAAQTLLGGEIKIAAARGRLFQRKGVPVVVTYHPAYLLRNPQDKARAWEDLCFARASVV